MDKIATENLFLLEFLVDKIKIDSCAGGIGCCTGEMCVSIQFLDNAPLDICEDDFAPRAKKRYPCEEDLVKSGKSCLFSLTQEQAKEATQTFDVNLDIFKKTQPGILPEKIQVGNCLVSIAGLFVELIDSITSTSGESPSAKTLKDTFKITGNTGQVIGDISIYIRMSCFGKLIVTQFQMNLQDKSVLFKDKEGHSLYRYKKAGQKVGESAVCPAWNKALGGDSCPVTPCAPPSSACGPSGGGAQLPACAVQKVDCPNVPCGQGQPQVEIPCNECEARYQQQKSQSYGCPQAPCPMPPCMQQQQQQPSEDPRSCYQEIGAEMGGNALTIRVHKDRNKIEEYDGDDDDCGCYCLPGGGKLKKKSNYTAPGGQANCGCRPQPQSYSMRAPCDPANQPFSLKMGGCGAAGGNNVMVTPPSCTAPDGTQYTEISDPNKDVFVLRIGKKSEGADKKNNLELELCTPKPPEKKPPIKKETRDSQYDELDFGGGKEKAGKKGKKGKEGKKGGKGKGKGKGKKK